MAEKKRSVGLIVTTTEDYEPEQVAVLQIRGLYNVEKGFPESWPGGCQVTVHGGCNPLEDDFVALYREIEEEFGLEAACILREYMHPLSTTKIFTHEDEKKVVTTFAIRLPDLTFLKAVRLHASSGGIRIVNVEDIPNIQDLTKFDRREGVVDRRIIAMFPDELEALKKAFG